MNTKQIMELMWSPLEHEEEIYYQALLAWKKKLVFGEEMQARLFQKINAFQREMGELRGGWIFEEKVIEMIEDAELEIENLEMEIVNRRRKLEKFEELLRKLK